MHVNFDFANETVERENIRGICMINEYELAYRLASRLTRGKKIKAVKTILNIRLQSRINYLGIRKKL